ncbi:putative disease resistance RPP13-like protein 1 [Macadamia integrifolia]|uniref:putative disease resistance RPP13-like protein 1 n=1 Tax=Macadamia integrifolia TaxID=60698 RepID=UPI001C4EBC3B|nr:putative disease resistance RPP13-like protein 1 [Macadamia integrifolia]
MGSRSLRHMILSQRPPTSSLVNRSKVFGRDEDMWKIIRLLQSRPSNNDNNFSVLPIVGIGGVGKTTLAQFVYNHEIIQKHFNLKAWVCVSEDYDVVKLTQKILESIPGSTLPSNSLDALQVKLKETLTNKRFLFVLDGMWNEIDDDMWNEIYERWDALRIPFTFGKPGSKILVTTRNKGVASILRTDHCHYHDLKGLSDKDCLEIFRRHAFMDENSSYANEKLKVFGEKILNKSKGLPLVVKIFAGVLRVKTENSEWKDTLEKQVEPNINLVTHNSENGSTVSQNTSFNKFVHGVDPQIHLIFNMRKRSCL